MFYENRLLADDSHEISYLILFEIWGKISQNLLSAAVVTGVLRVSSAGCCCILQASLDLSFTTVWTKIIWTKIDRFLFIDLTVLSNHEFLFECMCHRAPFSENGL